MPPSARRRARREEAPPAPWSPFPLVELCILVGIVLFILGLVRGGSRGHLVAGLGFSLIGLSTLEFTIREHFAGYRSHSSLLAGACTVVVAVVVILAAAPPVFVTLAVAAGVFVTAWSLLRTAFRRRSGGLGWRA